MKPADGFKRIFVHCLRINTYSVHTCIFCNHKLFPCDCIGSACLKGKFLKMRKVKIFVHIPQNFGKLFRGNRRWSAAADIYVFYVHPQLGKNRSAFFYFFSQKTHIFVHIFFSRAHIAWNKWAVKAFWRAKRYPYIHARRIFIRSSQNFSFLIRNL